MKQRFDVTGMTCSACSAHVEKAVRACSGVSDVSVNLLQNSMAVEYNEQAVGPDTISERPGRKVNLIAYNGQTYQKERFYQAVF